MAARYTLRMQFGPHETMRQIREELIETCRKAKADEVMFFAFAEEQNDGHDSLERIRAWMAAIRPWKRALERKGIEVSLNPWHSVLHCDRGRHLKPGQNWQPMMDWRGRAATAVVCPLDPGWRAYYLEALRLFAAEGFRVIWVDDDIRYHNHDPLDWGGCWCPLHVAAFNQRTGANADREAIVRAALAPGAPHPWRAAWMDLWDEQHCALLAEWRDVVEAAGSRLGLMSSDPEVHAAEGRRWERWWPSLAARFENVHRPHFWGYSEGGPELLPVGMAMLHQNRMTQPETVESAPEIECFPYGPWNKSYRQTLAQMSLAQVFGSDRLAVSLYDFMGNLPSDDPERARFLGRMKPMLAWIGEQFPRALRPVGVGVPWNPDMGRAAHLDGRVDWRVLELRTRGWDRWLAAFGIAFSKEAQPLVNAVSGPVAWAIPEDTLREWLTRGLLLDGPAAAILIARGFGEAIGMDQPRFMTQEDVLYAMEESLGPEFGLRVGAQMSLNAEKPYKDRLLQAALHPNAHVVSVLRTPIQAAAGHGMVLFENAHGGRAAIAPWDATAGTNLCVQRQAQIRKVVAWLARDRACGMVEGGAWLTPLFMTDGACWRGAVWNGSADACPGFTVTPPEGMPPLARAVLCTSEGRRIEIKVEDNHVALPKRMQQWECVILNPAE